MMHHPYAVAGLIANMVAALMLLYFPPATRAYTPEGAGVVTWVNRPTPEGRRQYDIRRNGSQMAIGLLFLGFFLQLLDLIKA
jgi:hypothetical protein